MSVQNEDTTIEKLRGERRQLEERLRLLESDEVADSEGGSQTETPSSVRDQIGQIDRLIEQQSRD